MGNDHEIEFHEIERVFFQEIERTIVRSKVIFFRRSKISMIFDNFVPEIDTLIRRSKVKINFQSHEKIVSHKFDHEIES